MKTNEERKQMIVDLVAKLTVRECRVAKVVSFCNGFGTVLDPQVGAVLGDYNMDFDFRQEKNESTDQFAADLKAAIAARAEAEKDQDAGPDPIIPTFDITTKSFDLFMEYARDAGNWSGTPLVGGNVGGSKEDRGNLTQLKKAGLITTFVDDGIWVDFTPAGRALAIRNGVESFT